MEILSVLLFCIVLVLFPTCGQSQPGIDYYQVVFQWPAALCNTSGKSCVPDPPSQRHFTLHGLWPDNTTEKLTPKECLPRVPYAGPNPTQVPALHTEWPNILNAANDAAFWQLQWDSHGVCDTRLTQDQFFGLAIRLSKAIDINKLLLNRPPPAAVGLRSGASNTFDVSAEILTKLRVLPRLRCNKDKSKRLQLIEIVICYNGRSQTYINCPTNRPSNCPPPGVAYYLP